MTESHRQQQLDRIRAAMALCDRVATEQELADARFVLANRENASLRRQHEIVLKAA